jgi:hypothetical protein
VFLLNIFFGETKSHWGSTFAVIWELQRISFRAVVEADELRVADDNIEVLECLRYLKSPQPSFFP